MPYAFIVRLMGGGRALRPQRYFMTCGAASEAGPSRGSTTFEADVLYNSSK